MDTVLLYGNDKDNAVAGTLFAAVRAMGGAALHMTQKAVSLIPPGAERPEFLVLEKSEMPEMHVGGGIIVFKQGLSVFQTNFTVPGGFSAVVDPVNEEAVRLLKKSGLQTITCGMSLRDTLTFSSIDIDSAVVSLQRTINTLHAETVEPRELPIRFSRGRDPFALLAAVGVLLLCGKAPQENLLIK